MKLRQKVFRLEEEERASVCLAAATATSSGFITPSRKPFSLACRRWGERGGKRGHLVTTAGIFKFPPAWLWYGTEAERGRWGNFATAAKSIIALQRTSAGEMLSPRVQYLDTNFQGQPN